MWKQQEKNPECKAFRILCVVDTIDIAFQALKTTVMLSKIQIFRSQVSTLLFYARITCARSMPFIVLHSLRGINMLFRINWTAYIPLPFVFGNHSLYIRIELFFRIKRRIEFRKTVRGIKIRLNIICFSIQRIDIFPSI